MEESTVRFRPRATTSKEFAPRLLTLGENRLELLTVEVQEERERLLDDFLWAVRDDPARHIAAVLPKPFGDWELPDTVRHALQASGEAVAAGAWACHRLQANPQPVR
jgi:hypothetical protein